VAESETHAVALSFARWRMKVPAPAVCITEPGAVFSHSLPEGLRRWLARTQRAGFRIAFALGDEWWAYDFLELRARHGSSSRDSNRTKTYFVIASSDRLDPEWGADHEHTVATDSWKIGAGATEATRRRLASRETRV
jgi:hypothetical protein